MNPLVCIPTRSTVHAMTMASVFRTCAGFPGPVGFQTFLAQPVDHARNLCVRHFLGGDWTHLFFVDSDIELPDDALLRLLAADVPIASGLYPLHRPAEGLCLSAAVETGPQRVQFITRRPDGPTEADVTGLGCCLIRRDVLERMSDPWFRFGVRADDGALIDEDIDFFLRVRDQSGIHPVVIPEVLCGHHREVDLGALWLTAEAAIAAAEGATSPDAAASPATESATSATPTGTTIVEPTPAATSIPGIPPATAAPTIPEDEAASLLAAVDALTTGVDSGRSN